MAPLIAVLAQTSAAIDERLGEGKSAVEHYARWGVYFVIVCALVLLLAGGATGEIPRGAIPAAIKRPLIIAVLLGGGLWVIITWAMATGNELISAVFG